MTREKRERLERLPFRHVVGGAVSVGALLLFLFLTVSLLGYPYGVDYEEGVVLDTVGRMIEAQPIYTAPEEMPHVLDRYGPLYPYLAAQLYRVFGFGYFGGRVVSLGASVGCAFLLFRIAARLGAGAFAPLAGGFFLATAEIAGAGALHRPEMAGLFLGLLALFLALREDQARFFAWIPAVLAFFTAPLLVAGPLAAASAFVARSRRDGVLFFGPLVVFGAGGVVVAQVLSGGQFLRHILPFGSFDFWTDDLARRFLGPLLFRYLPALCIAVFSIRRGLRKRDWPLVVFGVAPVVTGLRAGFESEDGAVLVEVIAALSLLVVVALRDLDLWSRAKPAVVGLAVLQGVILVAGIGNPSFPSALRERLLERDQSVWALVSAEKGYILSDNPCYPALTKKGLYLEPRAYRAWARRAAVDERELLALVKKGFFARGIIEYEADEPYLEESMKDGSPDRLPRVVRTAVRDALPMVKSFSVSPTPTRHVITEVWSTAAVGEPRQ